MKRMEIELPIPMPTWNKVIGMHHMERMKLRHLLHLFVSLSITHGKNWPTWTVYQGKQCSTELLLLEYLQMIRPNKSRKSLIAKKKAELKKRSSSSRP